MRFHLTNREEKLIPLHVISFLFYRPVTEATKPPQQLSTPNSSGDINVTSLIAKLLTGYDKRLRPNFGGQKRKQSLIFLKPFALLLMIARINPSCIPVSYNLRDGSSNDCPRSNGMRILTRSAKFTNLVFLNCVNLVPLCVNIISLALSYLG